MNKKWGEKMSDKIIDLGLSEFMTKTREEFAKRDNLYGEQERMTTEAEKKYEALELQAETKEIIEEYIEKMRNLEQQYADISYMAGMKDAVLILSSLGLLKIDMNAL